MTLPGKQFPCVARWRALHIYVYLCIFTYISTYIVDALLFMYIYIHFTIFIHILNMHAHFNIFMHICTLYTIPYHVLVLSFLSERMCRIYTYLYIFVHIDTHSHTFFTYLQRFINIYTYLYTFPPHDAFPQFSNWTNCFWEGNRLPWASNCPPRENDFPAWQHNEPYILMCIYVYLLTSLNILIIFSYLFIFVYIYIYIYVCQHIHTYS